MRKATKSYWVVEIHKRTDVVFRKWIPGNLSEREVSVILQRLASRDLSPSEIVAASLRSPRRTSHLEARVDGPPNSKRPMVWLPTSLGYVATFRRADEMADIPEIIPD